MMAAAQAGDRVAYQGLLRECIPLIQRVARRQGVQPAAIDDVVQEVLLRTAEPISTALVTGASGGVGAVYADSRAMALQQVEQRVRPISGGTAGNGKGHHDQRL
jgi:hypothetical protein